MQKETLVWEKLVGAAHKDFDKHATVPLQQGRFLGHGINGGVYETTCSDIKFAWKRRYCRTSIGPMERREIEILRKLKHRHVIRLVGSYTQGPFLGLLLWPVAVCDLSNFFESLEYLKELNPKDTKTTRSEDKDGVLDTERL